MSLEHELAELSTVYHGQRERMEALEQLVRDYHAFCSRLGGFAMGGVDRTYEEWVAHLFAMQQRARELLGDKP